MIVNRELKLPYLEEHLIILGNEIFDEFRLDVEIFKRKRYASRTIMPGNAILYIAEIYANKFKRYLDNCFFLYKELFDGEISKIYTPFFIKRIIASINTNIELFEKKLISFLSNQTTCATDKYLGSLASIKSRFMITVKAHLITVMKKSWQTNIWVTLLRNTLPVILATLVGDYLGSFLGVSTFF